MRTLHEARDLSWLCGKTWGQVTREERYFCAELFFVIREDIRKDNHRFVQFLNRENHWKKAHRPIPKMNWDPAYEVCFYRDIARHYYSIGKDKPKGDFSQKRTFDLALFSNEAIILIEAKAHQGYTTDQLGWLDCDYKNVRKWVKVREEMIFRVGLISSKYRPVCDTQKHFDLIITWSGLACLYGDDARAKQIFSRADEIYPAKAREGDVSKVPCLK